MKEKVLFVNACLRGKEDSRTYGLCTTFLEEFSKNHKHYELEEIDLAAAGIEPIDGTDVNWILPLQKEKNYEDPVFDLAKQFAAAGLAQTEIGSKLGVPGFVVKNITTCARAYTISELEQAVKDFVDAEESVKTGRLEDKLSVELLIIKYSSKVK